MINLLMIIVIKNFIIILIIVNFRILMYYKNYKCVSMKEANIRIKNEEICIIAH